MTNTEEAKRAVTVAFMKSVYEGDGWPVEADEVLNDANRSLIAAMAAEHGECWLGKVNLYGEERHGKAPVLWKWDGDIVCNFGCAFVVPAYDAELERLIRERDDAPYTGAAGDVPRIEAIMARVTALGGLHLLWT